MLLPTNAGGRSKVPFLVAWSDTLPVVDARRALKVYLAGPLFSEAERSFLASCARTLREAGFDCFVPHEQEARLSPPTARQVLAVDCEGLTQANAVVAWVDGPTVDDGTACEIGIFFGLMQRGEPWRKGILGLATDDRLRRRNTSLEHGGLNLFVAGVIEHAGALCWSIEGVKARLLVWQREMLDAAP
jgi:Nucleoside 2-deoxyribosyltransferase